MQYRECLFFRQTFWALGGTTLLPIQDGPWLDPARSAFGVRSLCASLRECRRSTNCGKRQGGGEGRSLPLPWRTAFRCANLDFSPASAALSGRWCFRAPKGRPITAQANGLGFQDQVIHQALKGRAKTCSNFFPDSRFIPIGGAEQGFRRSPLQGSAGKQPVNPGRWPGLD